MIVKFSLNNIYYDGFYDRDYLLEIDKKNDVELDLMCEEVLKNIKFLVILVGEHTKENIYIRRLIYKSVFKNINTIEIDISNINPFGKGSSKFNGWLLDYTVKKYLWCEDKGYINFKKWINF